MRGDGSVRTSEGGTAAERRGASALFGLSRRWTAVAAVGLGLLVGGVIGAAVLPGWLLEGAPGSGPAGLLDRFVGLIIALVVLSHPAGVAYGLRNGGPALSYAIPVLPMLAGGAVAGQLTLTVDVALALCSGAAAATAATYAVSSADRPRASVVLAGTALAAGGTTVGAVALWQIAGAVGPHAASGVRVAAGFLAVAVVGLLGQVALLAAGRESAS